MLLVAHLRHIGLDSGLALDLPQVKTTDFKAKVKAVCRIRDVLSTGLAQCGGLEPETLQERLNAPL